MSIEEGAYPGKEMTSRRIPTRVEEFFAFFAHQLFLLAILFVCLFWRRSRSWCGMTRSFSPSCSRP